MRALRYVVTLTVLLLLPACIHADKVEMSMWYEGEIGEDHHPEFTVLADEPRVRLRVRYPIGYALEIERAWLITCRACEVEFEPKFMFRWRKGGEYELYPTTPLPNNDCMTKMRIQATFTPRVGKQPALTVNRTFPMTIYGFAPKAPRQEPRPCD